MTGLLSCRTGEKEGKYVKALSLLWRGPGFADYAHRGTSGEFAIIYGHMHRLHGFNVWMSEQGTGYCYMEPPGRIMIKLAR